MEPRQLKTSYCIFFLQSPRLPCTDLSTIRVDIVKVTSNQITISTLSWLTVVFTSNIIFLPHVLVCKTVNGLRECQVCVCNIATIISTDYVLPQCSSLMRTLNCYYPSHTRTNNSATESEVCARACDSCYAAAHNRSLEETLIVSNMDCYLCISNVHYFVCVKYLLKCLLSTAYSSFAVTKTSIGCLHSLAKIWVSQ